MVEWKNEWYVKACACIHCIYVKLREYLWNMNDDDFDKRCAWSADPFVRVNIIIHAIAFTIAVKIFHENLSLYFCLSLIKSNRKNFVATFPFLSLVQNCHQCFESNCVSRSIEIQLPASTWENLRDWIIILSQYCEQW